MAARETADILMQVALRVPRNYHTSELTAAQWMALCFFARANARSRTPAALAEFQGTTRGIVSLTVKSLLVGGYLARVRSESNGHSVSLTDKGHAVLAQNPFEVLVQAIESLDASERDALHHSLDRVLATIPAGDA